MEPATGRSFHLQSPLGMPLSLISIRFIHTNILPDSMRNSPSHKRLMLNLHCSFNPSSLLDFIPPTTTDEQSSPLLVLLLFSLLHSLDSLWPLRLPQVIARLKQPPLVLTLLLDSPCCFLIS